MSTTECYLMSISYGRVATEDQNQHVHKGAHNRLGPHDRDNSIGIIYAQAESTFVHEL